MTTVDKHELLFITNLKYFKAMQMIGGKSIFDRYKIASTGINRQIYWYKISKFFSIIL